MNLIKPIPPIEYVHAMRTALPEYTDPDDTAAALLLRDHLAYEVYSLNLKEFSRPEYLHRAAKSIGWRFMTPDPASDFGCHVVKSTSCRLLAVARTPDVNIAFHRLHQIEELLMRKPSPRWQRLRGDFELRGFRIPSLLMEGVWLHRRPKGAQDRDTDFFVPCIGFTEAKSNEWAWKLELLEPYSPEELLKEIGEASRKRLEQQKELYAAPAQPIDLEAKGAAL